MKGQLEVSTPEEYIAGVDEYRRADIASLHALIRKIAPKFEPFIYKGMLGYGKFHYKYDTRREGDWFRFGIASNKNYISLYVAAWDKTGYCAERHRDALPKASIGKSCVRFKRLSDLDPKALTAMLRDAVKMIAAN